MFKQISQLASKMLTYNKSRLVVSVIGVAISFFLSASQIGLLIGWIDTTSAIIRNAKVDLWIMAQQTQAFDYGTAIARNNIYTALSTPGVEWAEGMLMAWNIWQRGDGRRTNGHLLRFKKAQLGLIRV